MQSKVLDVDAYIAEAEPDRVEALTRIRGLARGILAGHDEVMAFGMPVYQRDGHAGFAFASQKQYVSLYLAEAAVAAHAEALADHDMGRCCLRFRKPASIDWTLVEQLLTSTRDAAGSILDG